MADLERLCATVAQIKADMGAPAVVIHNAVRATHGSLLAMDPDDLERNFRVNDGTVAPWPQTIPDMLAAGNGTILVTGNTINTWQITMGLFASQGRAADLAESMAREFGPQGIHVAYFIIDAAIDTPHPPIPRRDKPDDFFAKPTATRRVIPCRPPGSIHLVVYRRDAAVWRSVVTAEVNIVDAQIHLWGSGLPSNPSHRQVTRFDAEEAVALMDEAGVASADLALLGSGLADGRAGHR